MVPFRKTAARIGRKNLAGAAAALRCSRSGQLFGECIQGERTAIRQAGAQRGRAETTDVNELSSGSGNAPLGWACAPAHIFPACFARMLPPSSRRESAMTSNLYRSDETCPEHEHHPVIVAALVTFPVMILVSAVASLFGMG